MTGMDEMPDGRPLTLGGWPGKGVSAGDECKLLYTQHTGGAARDYGEEHKHFHSKRQQPVISLFGKSHCVVQVVALMYHSIHISPPNVPLHPNAKDYFLLIFRLRRR